MIAQLQAQNPLEPGNTNEYVSELAQFTQVEQTTNLAQRQRALERRAADRSHRHPSTARTGGAGTGKVESVQSTASGTTMTVEGVAGVKLTSITEVQLSPIYEPRTAPARRGSPRRRADAAPAGPAPRRAPPTRRLRLVRAMRSKAGRSSAQPLQFSRHALARVQRRGIELDRPRCKRLSEGVDARPARARATPSYLSTAPPSWCPSATAP